MKLPARRRISCGCTIDDVTKAVTVPCSARHKVSRREPLCARCRHRQRHHRAGSGSCGCSRSTPGGHVYPCGCESFAPRSMPAEWVSTTPGITMTKDAEGVVHLSGVISRDGRLETDPEYGVLAGAQRAHLRREPGRTLCGVRLGSRAWMPRRGEEACKRCERSARRSP